MANKTNYREQLELFFQYVADAASENDEAAGIALRDAGLDSDEIVKRGRVMLRRVQARVKMAQEKARRMSLVATAEERLKAIISKAGSAKQALRQHISNEPAFTLQHHKLKKLNEEEAERILREELILRISGGSDGTRSGVDE